MQMLGWMKHKLESRLLGEISIISDTTLMAESEEELKSLLMKVKEESEKVGSELNIQKRSIQCLLCSRHGSKTFRNLGSTTEDLNSLILLFNRSVVSDSFQSHGL